ncbi:hypothetical protein EON76_02865 [bacterium]|nr:MAG: hypothetical protein EON76_02865 [bacterium]
MSSAEIPQKSQYDGIDFHGLFYDALSGEFFPPQDTLKRTHTLGRLAYATALNSLPTVNEVQTNTFLYEHVYTPTWASGLEVTTSGIVTNNRLLIDTVFLNADKTGDELVVTGMNEGVVSIKNHIPNDTMPGLGEHELSLSSIESTRLAVTGAAQTFFSRNHHK